MCGLLSSGKVLYQTQPRWYSLTGNRLFLLNNVKCSDIFNLKKWNWFRFSVCHIAGGVQVNSYFGDDNHPTLTGATRFLPCWFNRYTWTNSTFYWLFEIIDEIFGLWVCMFFVVDINYIHVFDKNKVSWEKYKITLTLHFSVWSLKGSTNLPVCIR